jgi:glycerol-3-phosphate acyltransferase PlsX
VSARPVNLALDAHGGDRGIDVTLPAALETLGQAANLHILLVGLPAELEGRLAQIQHERLEVVPAECALPQDSGPVTALRQGARSSLGAAMQLVAEGRADACVSAGNTAAMVALGVKRLGLLAGIRRPALMSDIPSVEGMTSVLDLGANLDVSAEQLVQFAIMGAEARTFENRALPRVGLLNVGHEETKGHAVVRDAHRVLRDLPLNYIGFVEGHDIFAGRVDVAVCDGFAGNLLLKSSEGLARMLFGELRDTFTRDWRSRLGGWLAKPALKGMLEQLDPGKHNGAPLLGLAGVVVKSHGSADQRATVHAILEAMQEAERQVPERIEESIQRFGAGDNQ